MRIGSSVMGFALLLLAGNAGAVEEVRLVESINLYRGEVRSCAGQSFEALPPLAADERLVLPAQGRAELHRALGAATGLERHARRGSRGSQPGDGQRQFLQPSRR